MSTGFLDSATSSTSVTTSTSLILNNIREQTIRASNNTFPTYLVNRSGKIRKEPIEMTKDDLSSKLPHLSSEEPLQTKKAAVPPGNRRLIKRPSQRFQHIHKNPSMPTGFPDLATSSTSVTTSTGSVSNNVEKQPIRASNNNFYTYLSGKIGKELIEMTKNDLSSKLPHINSKEQLKTKKAAVPPGSRRLIKRPSQRFQRIAQPPIPNYPVSKSNILCRFCKLRLRICANATKNGADLDKYKSFRCNIRMCLNFNKPYKSPEDNSDLFTLMMRPEDEKIDPTQQIASDQEPKPAKEEPVDSSHADYNKSELSKTIKSEDPAISFDVKQEIEKSHCSTIDNLQFCIISNL